MANTQQHNKAVAIREEQTRVGREITSLIEGRLANFADVLPPHISVDEFKRVLLTAIAGNTDLQYADRRTLLNSALKCAADGLLPDGRRAALVVYNTKIKERDPTTGLDVERRIDAVQYMPMVLGLREQMRNSGEVSSAVAEAVFQKDRFRYRLGDNAFIEHEPPPLGEDRGDVVGAYAIITLKSGEVVRDVMDRKTIEAARKKSRAPNSLMWTDFYWEGAKKTVLRRASKQAPLSPKLMRMLDRDAEPFALPDAGGTREVIENGHDQHHREPEPERPRSAGMPPPVDPGPQYAVVDVDGVENVFSDPARAVSAIDLMLTEAEKLGPQRLEGLWESNQTTLEALSAAGHGQAVGALAARFSETITRLKAPKPPAQEEQQPADTSGSRSDPDDAGDPDRESLEIQPVVNHGKPDWRAWTVALFVPKLRKHREGRTLAYFLGDNDKHLQEAYRHLDRSDKEELEAAIKHQWDVVSKPATAQ